MIERCLSSLARGALRSISGFRVALMLAVLLGIWLPPLAAYYPFLHLKVEDGRWLPIPERFDLRKAPAGAVPVVVSRPVEISWQDGDNWEALVSEVKLASTVWSEVTTSSLRLGYAGEVDVNAESPAPHIQVVFEDLPPGVIAMAGPVSLETQERDEQGLFVPIAKSLVIHNADLRHRPTYGEAFFRTLVHEIGHAIGLQHTFTASAMSTGVTRSTTKAAALAPDDRAGVSWLYPGPYFRKETGTLRGSISVAGDPLHFASVVALSPSGVAVSAITLPDGTYEIQGLPSGYYYLYAQMIPPSSDPSLGPGQIVLPVDEQGRTLFPGPSFGTRFYPDAVTWNDAFLIDVQAGSVLDGLDIDVPPQAPSQFQGVTTFSFFGQTVNQPAVLDSNDSERFLVASGPNLMDAPEGLDGLQVDALGAFVWESNVFPYPFAPEFLQVSVQLSPFSFSGPKALLFRRNQDVYVQPAAFHLVGQVPPSLQDVAAEANAEGTLLRLRGEELGVVSQYIAEGLPISAQPSGVPVSSGNRATGVGEPGADRNTETTLRQPYTGDGRQVAVVALARDRQSSLFANPDPPRVASLVAPHGSLRMQPNSLPAGSHAALLLESDQPLFSGDHLWVDFGSPSLVVTGVWKQSDQRLLLNVAVGANAKAGSYAVRVHNDLALREPGATLQVVFPRQDHLKPGETLWDVETASAWPRSGATAEIRLPGLDEHTPIEVLMDGRLLAARWAHRDVLHFEIPHDIVPSVVTWKVLAAGQESLPLTSQIFAGPPRIVAASVSANSGQLAEGRAVSARFRASLQLPEDMRANGPGDLRVRVNGRIVSGVQTEVSEEDAGAISIGFSARLPWQEAAENDIVLRVEWNGRPSASFRLRLRQVESAVEAAFVATH